MEPLTNRQHEVLTLMAEGLSRNDIAKRLYISNSTSKNHMSEIYRKLEIHNNVQAVIWYYTQKCEKCIKNDVINMCKKYIISCQGGTEHES